MREQDCSTLRKRVDELTPVKRTPESNIIMLKAQAAISELGPTAIIVLRQLDAQDELVFRPYGVSPPLPTNMTAQDFRSMYG